MEVSYNLELHLEVSVIPTVEESLSDTRIFVQDC